jgi:Short C-terminal domain
MARELFLTNGRLIQSGIMGYPSGGTSYGMAVIFDKSFAFYDGQIKFKIPYTKVLEVKLENFQVGAVRGMLTLGSTVALQLQQIQNMLSLRYTDEKGTERNAKFQIKGALTIPGEGDRAREFLNYLIEFKSDFAATSTASDPTTRLEKPKALKDKGIISEEEFQAKKQKLLEEM